MKEIFNSWFYEPMVYVLHYLYGVTGDVGLSIIILTIFIRVVLYPLFYRGAKDQLALQSLQPKIKELQEKYKDDKERQAKEIMALYKENKTNPFSGFLVLLVQIPIFLSLFYTFKDGAADSWFDSFSLLGLIDLRVGSVALTILAAALQYIQLKMAAKAAKSPTPAFLEWLGPGLTIVVLWSLPGALALYWSVSNLFSLFQQWYLNRKLSLKS
jgi:YidC/Oxa1 family membrane protein insertase